MLFYRCYLYTQNLFQILQAQKILLLHIQLRLKEIYPYHQQRDLEEYLPHQLLYL